MPIQDATETHLPRTGETNPPGGKRTGIRIVVYLVLASVLGLIVWRVYQNHQKSDAAAANQYAAVYAPVQNRVAHGFREIRIIHGVGAICSDVQDVVAKSLGSSNPYNVVRATFDALKHQDSPRSVAARRNIKVSTLQSRRRDGDAEAAAD
jgi:hypothetical protein